jgi:hypothetical protein
MQQPHQRRLDCKGKLSSFFLLTQFILAIVSAKSSPPFSSRPGPFMMCAVFIGNAEAQHGVE